MTTVLLALVLGINPGAEPQSLQQVLALAPPELVTQLSPQTLEDVRQGIIPLADFARSLGVPVTGMAESSELQQKQFITHWLDHYYALSAGINEDIVGESSISGRCSGLKLTDASKAPTMDPSLYSKKIATYYWQAPFDSAICVSDNTDLTRYFVTWVKSPTAQSVRAWLGASDYFKLWINGTLVGERTSGGAKAYTEDEYKFPATLQAGWNLIVFKHSFPQLGPANDPNPNNLYKYFSLRFVHDDAGTPVTNLVATFDPDPSCQEPADRNTAVYTRALFPSVAHLPGQGGSQWRTDIELYNGFHMAWEVRFRYYREGNNSGIPDATKTVVLQPFESKVFPDALRSSEFFNVASDQKGYAWVSGKHYYDLYYAGNRNARAKVYNQASNGTFGMETPIAYVYNFIWRKYFFTLRNGSYRINLAIVPHKNQDASYRVKLILSDPAFGVLTKEWPADPAQRLKGFAQLNDVFGYFGKSSTTTDRALLYVEVVNFTPSELSFYPYVTINDNGTSDPLFVPPGWSSPEPPIF